MIPIANQTSYILSFFIQDVEVPDDAQSQSQALLLMTVYSATSLSIPSNSTVSSSASTHDVQQSHPTKLPLGLSQSCPHAHAQDVEVPDDEELADFAAELAAERGQLSGTVSDEVGRLNFGPINAVVFTTAVNMPWGGLNLCQPKLRSQKVGSYQEQYLMR